VRSPAYAYKPLCCPSGAKGIAGRADVTHVHGNPPAFRRRARLDAVPYNNANAAHCRCVRVVRDDVTRRVMVML